MNKEEKKAIELIKFIQYECRNNKTIIPIASVNGLANAIEIVLNLIEKNNKEIKVKDNLIKYMTGVSDGMYKENKKLEEENKILKSVFNQIRDLTHSFIVWYNYNTKNYNLRGCSKQEIYQNFSRIRNIVYAHYYNMDNDEALKTLIDDKLKVEENDMYE